MHATETSPDASPTLICGVGPVGWRIASVLEERFANTFWRESGMLEIAEGADPRIIGPAIDRLTLQSKVIPAEVTLGLRSPLGRYVRLQLVAFANLGELVNPNNELLEAVDAFIERAKPEDGVQIGVFLDVSAPGSSIQTSRGLPELLAALDQRTPGNDRPMVRTFLVHRSLMDRTHIDHPNLSNPNAEDPDEFEVVVARLAESMLRPGSDLAWTTLEEGGGKFATIAGGSCVFPRELLLSETSGLIGADILERTVRPDVEERAPERLIATREDLVRQALALLPDFQGALVPSSTEVGRPTLYDTVFRKPGQLPSHGFRVTTVAMTHPLNGATLHEFAEHYEAVSVALVDELAARVRSSIEDVAQTFAAGALDSARHQIDAMVTGELGGVDRAIRSVAAAQRQIIDALTRTEIEAAGKADPRIQGAGAPAPEPPYVARNELEFPEATADLAERFGREVRRLPDIPAVAVRGLLCGSVLAPLGATMGFGLAGVWVTALLTLGVFGGVWLWRRARLERMRRHLAERLEDRLGKVLYDGVQTALGAHLAGRPDDEATPVLGALPQIWRYLEDWEKPLLNGFDALRENGIRLMRRLDGWPDGFQPGVDWLDLEDPRLLHEMVREGMDDDALTSAAWDVVTGSRRVEGRHDADAPTAFSLWRCPSFPEIERTAKGVGRGRLAEYERLSIGEFTEVLSQLHATPTTEVALHASRVVKRMDLLALRCVPMAPLMPEPDPRDAAFPDEFGASPGEDPHEGGDEPRGPRIRRISIHAPESLNWAESVAITRNTTKSPGDVPNHSAFMERLTWLFHSPSAEVETAEADHASALALFPTNDPEAAASWFHQPFTETPEGGSRFALLVGMENFAQDPLPGVIAEMEGFRAELEALGFDVATCYDASLTEMDDAVRRFADKLHEEAIGMFAFSGHGCEVDGANMLSTVREGSFNLDRLFTLIREKRATNIMILDCCRVVYPGSRDSGPIHRIEAPPNTLIAYATTEGLVAYGGIYIEELTKLIGLPNTRIEDVLIKTRRAVLDRPNAKQTPSETGSLLEVVVLNPQASVVEEAR